MPKRKTVKPSSTEVMARLLRDAYIAAYCKINPYHDEPGWEEIKRLGQFTVWMQVAEEALRLGLRAPLPGVEPEEI